MKVWCCSVEQLAVAENNAVEVLLPIRSLYSNSSGLFHTTAVAN
jgi:hypothetical protein